MEVTTFGPFFEIIGALALGAILGFTLSRSALTEPSALKKQLLFKQNCALKIALTALTVASLGIYIYKLVNSSALLLINTSTLGAAFWGAGFVGLGLFLLGFCPGTCLVALASGSKRALWGAGGMIIGALFYAKIAPFIHEHIKKQANFTKATLEEYFFIPHGFMVALLLCATLIFFFKDKKLTES
jgi:uncharacterized membrane protein YedE/YeeE